MVRIPYPTKDSLDLLEVDFDFTSYGSPASWDDPGAPPEIVIRDISWIVNTPLWLNTMRHRPFSAYVLQYHIEIPKYVWDARVKPHWYAYSGETEQSLYEYCETHILVNENPSDYMDYE